jgi:hypothetical protein
MPPNSVATISGVFWMVKTMNTIETIQGKYLFLTKNGKKQKFTLSSLF